MLLRLNKSPFTHLSVQIVRTILNTAASVLGVYLLITPDCLGDEDAQMLAPSLIRTQERCSGCSNGSAC